LVICLLPQFLGYLFNESITVFIVDHVAELDKFLVDKLHD